MTILDLGVLCLASAALAAEPAPAHSPAEILGTWRGTSICTDLAAAPSCHDETVVYDFEPGDKPGTILWKADKIVDGKRLPMGELDLTYDTQAGAWTAKFNGPNARSVWRLTVQGTHISGGGWLLPGNQRVRKVEVDKQ